jgi:hypothetical protein
MRTLLSPLSVTLDDAPTTAINGSSSADSAQLPITNIVKRIRYVRHTVRDEPKPAPRSMPLVYRSGGSTGGINISHEFAEPRFRDVATENWRKDQQRTWR